MLYRDTVVKPVLEVRIFFIYFVLRRLDEIELRETGGGAVFHGGQVRG